MTCAVITSKANNKQSNTLFPEGRIYHIDCFLSLGIVKTVERQTLLSLNIWNFKRQKKHKNEEVFP